MLRVLVSSVLLLFLGRAGEGEVRGRLPWAGGGRLLTGDACTWAACWAGSQGGSVSVSVFFVLPPNLGIRLNRLARRFFVVGDSWFVAFLISCSGVAASSFSLRPLVMCRGSAVRVGDEDSSSAPGEFVRSSSVEMVDEHSEPTVITDSGRSGNGWIKFQPGDKRRGMREEQKPTLTFIALSETVSWHIVNICLLSLGDVALRALVTLV